ncbi:hypothetical protein C8R48DRAFT_701218 [Suillus tomentosus]|nr:hypothetical protein C8R48DRAFT_701218 [Suillus tomentosus]
MYKSSKATCVAKPATAVFLHAFIFCCVLSLSLIQFATTLRASQDLPIIRDSKGIAKPYCHDRSFFLSTRKLSPVEC